MARPPAKSVTKQDRALTLKAAATETQAHGPEEDGRTGCVRRSRYHVGAPAGEELPKRVRGAAPHARPSPG